MPMKHLALITIALGFVLTSNAQYSEKQITLLTKINCGLTEAWTVGDIDEGQETLGDDDDAESVTTMEFELKHYKARENGEEGIVFITLFPKDKAKQVKSADWSQQEEKVDFVETKSF